MKATIVTIGDEILIGQICDTNSQFISNKLTLLGIEVINIFSIADQALAIKETIEMAMQKSDIVIVTGGLGPTKDDITKKVLADYFGSNLVLNLQVSEQIQKMCYLRGVEPNELNKQQALLPDNCVVLPNEKGTASGMWFNKNNKILISLPGVPFEMIHLMETQVISKLKSIAKNLLFDYRLLTVYGVPESALSIFLSEWENNLESYYIDNDNLMQLAYLPSTTMIKLRITAKGSAVNYLDFEFEKLQLLLKRYKNINNKDKELPPKFLFTTGSNDNIETLFANVLNKTNATVCTAESCTGGYIAHLITSIPGSSKYFKGSIIAYSNVIKNEILNIPNKIIDTYGAVSEQVVRLMAENVKKIMKTDYSIATSGIAGPDGGSEQKPVGTVWIAVATPNDIFSSKYNFSATRERVIGKSAIEAMKMLLEHF